MPSIEEREEIKSNLYDISLDLKVQYMLANAYFIYETVISPNSSFTDADSMLFNMTKISA